MKCVRCATELPGQAQFCLKCGTPVGSMPSAASAPMSAASRSGAVRMSAPAKAGPKKGLIAAAVAGLAVLALAGFFGYRNLTNRSDAAPKASDLLKSAGKAPDDSRLLNTGNRIGDNNALATSKGPKETAPADPVDVMDYLAFLKGIEQQRIRLSKNFAGQIMALIPTLQGGNAMGEMQNSEDAIAKKHNDDYKAVQDKMSEITADWNNLSAQFIKKPAPQSCQQLANYYYEALSKTQGSIVAVANAFSQALSDPSKAGDIVSKLNAAGGKGEGSLSKSVDDACDKADGELDAVCNKFRIHKDFDIKPDGGGSNPFGM